MLLWFIDAVCPLGNQEFPFQAHDDDEYIFN